MNTVEPDAFPSLRQQALASMRALRYQDALAFAARALKLRPRAWRLIALRGDALAALGRNAPALAAYARALTVKPDEPTLLFRQAKTQRTLRRPADALASYDRILALVPDSAPALLNRGNTLRALGRNEEALESFHRALAARPGYPEALNNIGNTLQTFGRYAEAMQNYRDSLAAKPDYVDALNNLGNAQQMLAQYREAIVNYDRALALAPGLAAVKWNKGTTMLHLELSREAWELYEYRLGSDTHGRLASLNLPLLGSRPLRGEKLLLQWEARFGDIMQMMRYVPMVQGAAAACWLQVAPALRDLAARSFPQAHIVSPGETGEALFRLPYTSLPLVMETFSEAAIPAAVPYLVPDADKVAHWMRAAAGGAGEPRIGLAWRGNAVPAHRSASLQAIEPFFKLPKLHFVTLQKDLSAAEREALQGRKNVSVLDAELASFDDTAAVVAGLDLMISIDSAVAHLAGALGKPAWVMLKLGADWRWMSERDDTPWYPSARLFRQAALGDWDPVVRGVCEELARFAAPGKPAHGAARARPRR
jgi:tetratricopeptide (TPR) repeat protein